MASLIYHPNSDTILFYQEPALKPASTDAMQLRSG